MNTARREWKDATRSTRIAAAVAIVGIVVVGIGSKIVHDLMEARSHVNAAESRR